MPGNDVDRNRPQASGDARPSGSTRGRYLKLGSLVLIIWVLVSFARREQHQPPASEELWGTPRPTRSDAGPTATALLSGPGPTPGTQVVLTYDSTLDDPMARWHRCIDQITACVGGSVGTANKKIAGCVAESACPSYCKSEFARLRVPAGTERDDQDLLAFLFLADEGPCGPPLSGRASTKP